MKDIMWMFHIKTKPDEIYNALINHDYFYFAFPATLKLIFCL
jgi:hypothetical protein